MDIVNKTHMFVHVPKTAGMSISAIFNSGPTSNFFRDVAHLEPHTTRSAVAKTHGKTPAFNNVFLVARHPVERLMSLYTQGVQYTEQFDKCQVCGWYRCEKHDVYDVMGYLERLPHEVYNQSIHMLLHKNRMPDNIRTLDFNNIEYEFRKLCYAEFSSKDIFRFPHINRKTTRYTKMASELTTRDDVRQIILERAREEIDFLDIGFRQSTSFDK